MAIPRQAYGGVFLYLTETCSRNNDEVIDDISYSMDRLEGDTLRVALRQLYKKWGDYSDQACEDFVEHLMMMGDALRKPRRHKQRADQAEGGMQASKQITLF